MNILLETQKYNHYKLLKENYTPKTIDFAITNDYKYAILENELFDINLNKSLGFYYESKLLNEGLIKESWLETIADIGVGVTSAVLDASGVGSGAAKAIDFLHALSFIYRGKSRNDVFLEMIGYFSLGTLLIPGLGSSIKATIVLMAKNLIGKPISFIIKNLAKMGNLVKFLPKFKSGLNYISGGISQFTKWAKEFTWFNKVWEPVSKFFIDGISRFGKFIDDILAKAGGKSGTTGVKSTQKALPVGTKALEQMGLGLNKVGAEAITTILKNQKLYYKPEEIVKFLSSNSHWSKFVIEQANKVGSKNLPKLEKMINSSMGNAGIVKSMSAQTVKAASTLIAGGSSIMIPMTKELAKKTSGSLVKTNAGTAIKAINVKTKEIVPVAISDVSKVFRIPKAFKYAAAVLIAVGLGGLIFGDNESSALVVYDDELDNVIKNTDATVTDEETTDSGVDKCNSDGYKRGFKTVDAPDINSGEHVTTHDRTWEYLKIGKNLYTKKQQGTQWFITMPGCKPYEAIKTKVYKDNV